MIDRCIYSVHFYVLQCNSILNTSVDQSLNVFFVILFVVCLFEVHLHCFVTPCKNGPAELICQACRGGEE